MIVAIVFYFQINTGLNGVDAFPEGAQTRKLSSSWRKSFPSAW